MNSIVLESEDYYAANINVAGYLKKDIEVEYLYSYLIIICKNDELGTKVAKILIPDNIDPKSIEAYLKNGLLIAIIRKKTIIMEEHPPRVN